MITWYARNDVPYSGGEKQLSITFPYIKKEHIKVFVNDVETTEYHFLNESQIFLDCELNTGDIMSVRRNTPIDERMVTFTDTSIVNAEKQNLAQNQLFNTVQEIYDNNEEFKQDTDNVLQENKIELETIIEANKQELINAQEIFKDEVNSQIEQVSSAAEKINQLEEAVDTAVTAANTAAEQAEIAINKANETTELVTQANTTIQGTIQDFTENIDSKISTNDENMQSVLTETEAILQETKDTLTGTLNKTQITNCLLEVPQRIKYTLENGTLTIKAGSVVIVPYGTEDLTANHPVGSRFLNDTFKVYDTQFEDGKFFVWAELVNDCSTDYIPNSSSSVQLTLGKSVWHTKELNFDYAGTNNIFSGANVPTTTVTNTLWYDTTNNVIKTSSDKGVTWEVTNNTFPFANANLTANVGVSSVNQVFNGMGYIGSTIWVDKGVKGLIPIGRNEDGTLKNIESTTSAILLINARLDNTGVVKLAYWGKYSSGKDSIGNLMNGWAFFTQDEQPIVTATYIRWYSPKDNKWRVSQDKGATWTEEPIVILCDYYGDTTKVTSMIIKQPFRAVDYNEAVLKEQLVDISEAGVGFPSNRYIDLTLGADGASYTAPSNGWVIFRRTSTAAGQILQISNETRRAIQIFIQSGKSSGVIGGYIPVQKGDKFLVSYNLGSATNQIFRFIYAEGAY